MHISMFSICIGLLVGYLLGWATNESSEARLYCTFITIGLGWILARAREYHANVLAVEYEAREKEKSNINAIRQELKKEIVREMKTEEKTRLFTDDNFSDDAKALLSKPIKEAKKLGVKITGQSLINSILKSFR